MLSQDQKYRPHILHVSRSEILEPPSPTYEDIVNEYTHHTTIFTARLLTLEIPNEYSWESVRKEMDDVIDLLAEGYQENPRKAVIALRTFHLGIECFIRPNINR